MARHQCWDKTNGEILVLDLAQSFILAIGAALGAFLMLCKLLETFEKILKKDKLERIVDGIMHIKFRAGSRKVLALWVHINNAIFGRKIISWKAFWISLLLTNIWAIIFILVFCIKYPMFRSWIFNIIELNSLKWQALTIYLAILIIEFLSISLTRKIYRTTLSRGKRTFAWALSLDLIGSIALFYIGITLIKLIVLHHEAMSPIESIMVWLDANNLTTLLRVTEDFDMSNFKPDGYGNLKTDIPLSTEVVYAFPEGVFFFTSLLTSIWLWGYIAAYSLAYVCVRIDRLPPVLSRWFKIEEQPLLVLSFLLGFIGTLIYLLISLIKLLHNI
ncbi:hypothetical protein [Pseudomonas yamanorum]